ncbi:MAG: class I SAM-dependent methyltransferase, partial [Anaerolineales bacterium]
RYRDHASYVAHQRAKRERWDSGALAEHDRNFRAVLRERLSRDAPIAPGMAVLCLGARMGGEVAAFRDLGCFAVGIDLNPGSANPYVLSADFHELPFRTACLDVVFTNSLDHASDIDRVVREVRRVLKPSGLLIVEAVRGSAEGVAPKFYESFFWDSIDDLSRFLTDQGFTLVGRRPFETPWQGEQLCFRRKA